MGSTLRNVRQDESHDHAHGQVRPKTAPDPDHASSVVEGPHPASGQDCFSNECAHALPSASGSYGVISLLEFMQAEGGPLPHAYDDHVHSTRDALDFLRSGLQSLWNALPTGATSSLITVGTLSSRIEKGPKLLKCIKARHL